MRQRTSLEVVVSNTATACSIMRAVDLVVVDPAAAEAPLSGPPLTACQVALVPVFSGAAGAVLLLDMRCRRCELGWGSWAYRHAHCTQLHHVRCS